MRLPELLLVGTLATCTTERGAKTDVDIAMSTQRRSATDALTKPTRTAEEIAADATWIISAQSQKNSLGQTNCENGSCPNIQALCTTAPDICAEAFNCAADRFGANGTIGWRDTYQYLEEQMKEGVDVLPQGAITFITDECLSSFERGEF